jgi:hypothetical protein
MGVPPRPGGSDHADAGLVRTKVAAGARGVAVTMQIFPADVGYGAGRGAARAPGPGPRGPAGGSPGPAGSAYGAGGQRVRGAQNPPSAAAGPLSPAPLTV